MKLVKEMDVRVRIQASWDDATGFSSKLFAEAAYIDGESKPDPEDPTKSIKIRDESKCTAVITAPRDADHKREFDKIMGEVQALLKEAAKHCEKDIDREVGVSIAINRQVARRMGEL